MGEKPKRATDGQPIRRGYQPSKDNLEHSNPPQGGSGVPQKKTTDIKKSTNNK